MCIRDRGKEKLFKKDYVEIKKDTFEQFKNMAKNYKKDTVAIKNTNINLPVSYTHLDVYKRQGCKKMPSLW